MNRYTIGSLLQRIGRALSGGSRHRTARRRRSATTRSRGRGGLRGLLRRLLR